MSNQLNIISSLRTPKQKPKWTLMTTVILIVISVVIAISSFYGFFFLIGIGNQISIYLTKARLNSKFDIFELKPLDDKFLKILNTNVYQPNDFYLIDVDNNLSMDFMAYGNKYNGKEYSGSIYGFRLDNKYLIKRNLDYDLGNNISLSFSSGFTKFIIGCRKDNRVCLIMVPYQREREKEIKILKYDYNANKFSEFYTIKDVSDKELSETGYFDRYFYILFNPPNNLKEIAIDLKTLEIINNPTKKLVFPNNKNYYRWDIPDPELLTMRKYLRKRDNFSTNLDIIQELISGSGSGGWGPGIINTKIVKDEKVILSFDIVSSNQPNLLNELDNQFYFLIKDEGETYKIIRSK